MPRRHEHHPGIENEPNFHGADPAPPPAFSPSSPDPAADPSEAKARALLGRTGPDADLTAAQHAVQEEPALRGHDGVFIGRDWSCAACDYNLRGLWTGQPCPECGEAINLAPPPTTGPGYASWLSDRMHGTSWARSWAVVALVAVAAGPWAVLGALFQGAGGYFGMIVLGPAVEEVMKIALIGLVIELRPYLFKSPAQIYLAALGSGLAFASIENLLYLGLYIPDPSADIIAWRIVVCTALHVGCTCIAAVGTHRSWAQAITQLRPAAVPVQLPWLVLAIVIHSIYNATVTFLELAGVLF